MKMVKNGEMIEITSEYNADFVRRVKLIGGQWGASKKVWSVPTENEELLIELLRECYGYTPDEEASAGVIKVEYRACDFEKDDVVKSEKALLTIIDEEAPLAKLLKQRDALLAQLAEVNTKIEELEKE